MIKGKSPKAMAFDIAEGYVSVNPLFLKPLDEEMLRALYQQLVKTQTEIRAEKFPVADAMGIRMRNMRLQRLYQAAMVMRNFARERRIRL